MSIKVTKVEVKPEPPPVKIVIELEGEDARLLKAFQYHGHFSGCMTRDAFYNCDQRDFVFDFLKKIGNQL